MTTVADYVGRTIDVLAFTGQDESRKTLLQQTLAQNGLGGEICTGIQKLAQRWVIEFLTETGSMNFLPDRGCDFMLLLRRGQLRTTLDAEQAFFLSAAQVKRNLRGEDADTDQPDEILDSADLLSMTVEADLLVANIQIHSQAGDARKIIMPIAVTLTG